MRHPGEILQEKLNIAGMSRKELAIRTGVTEKHVCTVVNGDRSISAGFARKLGYVFENPGYWMNLQNKYDEEQLKMQEANEVTPAEIEILKPLHEIMTYFGEKGYIHNCGGETERVIQLRDFLHISDLTLIPQITYNAAYRAQLTSNIKVNPYVLFAWQSMCEKETEDIDICKSIDKERLKKSIADIKKLMFDEINEGIQKLQDIFANCGIAFQVVKNFRGAPVQGFIKETLEGKVILCMTIRRKRADSFWFTLLHEIAHILNNDYKTRFVDFDSVQNKSEEAADSFARDELIDPKLYKKFISFGDSTSWESITAFAEIANVKPFIVLGRLQKDGYLDWSDYTDKIVRYEWA